MNNNSSFNSFEDDESSSDLLEEFFKYFFFWKYFLFSVLTLILIAFLVVRYTPKVYETNAKIQILDKKENKNLVIQKIEKLIRYIINQYIKLNYLD